MSEIQFDIEDCMFGDGSHAIHIAEAFDSKEIAEKFAKQIKSALKLQELIEERLKGKSKSGHKKLSDETGYLEQELRSLLEQSQTTLKEEGLRGKK